MEKKKELSWSDRHPLGNLSYYTFLDDFEGVKTLDAPATKSALRLLKRKLEDAISYELTDEQFTAIFFNVIKLAPAHPLGAYSFTYGFAKPMSELLDKIGLPGRMMAIFDFFNVRHIDARRYDYVLLHIPHASIAFPADTGYSFKDLDADERLLIDYYTDELYLPEKKDSRIENLVFPYCRFYCDVERIINDPLEKKGFGISYDRNIVDELGLAFAYRSFGSIHSVYKLYADFQTEVALKIMGRGRVLVVDCHSFSNIQNLLNYNLPTEFDICIGFNDDETCPNKVIVGNIVHYFRSLGYRVGVNIPFSNSKKFITPEKYHSLKIEVNKRLYMNEETLEKTEGFDKLKHDIQSLYPHLLIER